MRLLSRKSPSSRPEVAIDGVDVPLCKFPKILGITWDVMFCFQFLGAVYLCIGFAVKYALLFLTQITNNAFSRRNIMKNDKSWSISTVVDE